MHLGLCAMSLILIAENEYKVHEDNFYEQR